MSNPNDRMMSRRGFAAMLTLTASAGCAPGTDTAQGVAERFVDQHYVQMNLKSAETICTGIARDKVQKSIQLTQGVQIDDSTRKPRVSYQVTSHGETDSEASYVFNASVQVDGADTFESRWIVLTKKVDGKWMVANFTEE